MRPQELKNRRAIAGLTIRKLSEFSGISEATIGRIENGYTGASLRTLSQLERALERKTKEPCQELYEAARDVLATYQCHTDAPDWLIHEMAALLGAIQSYEGRS